MIFVVGATEARFARPVSEVIRLPSNALLSWLASYHRQRRGAMYIVIRSKAGAALG